MGGVFKGISVENVWVRNVKIYQVKSISNYDAADTTNFNKS